MSERGEVAIGIIAVVIFAGWVASMIRYRIEMRDIEIPASAYQVGLVR
jgi:acyl-coenzyme A synthetase/AMP-(fatty) acid ligase